jgi:hypothetical protein
VVCVACTYEPEFQGEVTFHVAINASVSRDASVFVLFFISSGEFLSYVAFL